MPQLAVKQLLPGSTGQVIATRAGVSVWEKLKPDALNGVTPAAGQVPYIASTSTFGASSDFTWDNSNKRLSVAGSVYLKGVLFDDQIAVPEETSSSSSSGANSKGVLWVRAGEPNTLVYTDNQGTDTTLGGGGLSGSGTVNTVAKFTGAAALGDSSITDTGALASCSVPFSVPGAGANSERFGAAATAAGASATAVGNGASAFGVNSTAINAITLGSNSIGIGRSSGTGSVAAPGAVVIGNSAGNQTFTGASHTICGGSAGAALTNGTLNSFYGYNSGATVTSGSNNVCAGANADVTVATISGVTVVGKDAKTGGADSVVIGYNAVNGAVANAVVIGKDAVNFTGTNAVFIGFGAGSATNTGAGNLAIGVSAASALTSGFSNTICGTDAGDLLTTGDSNCLYGNNAETQATGTANSVGIGINVVVGTSSVAVGSTCTANGTSSVSIGLGADAGTSAVSAAVVIGAFAGNTTFTGTENVLIGNDVAINLDSGFSNTICGSYAGTLLTTGGNNCLYGNNAETQAVGTASAVGIGRTTVVATQSVVIGSDATANAVTSVVIGYAANGGTVAATGSTVIGASAANATFTGTKNILIGSLVATALTGGASNTICGSDAGDVLTIGEGNCLYGYNAEAQANDVTLSVGIGYESIVGMTSVVVGGSASAKAQDSVVIGYAADGGTAAATSGIVIGDTAANATFTGIRNVLIGSSVASNLGSGTLNTIVGSDAGDLLTTGSSNCLYGFNCETSANSTANSVGMGTAVLVASNSVALGDGANVSNTSSIGIGSAAATTASNQFVAGSGAHPTNNVYFGKGASNAAPTVYTINGTASSGAAAGGDIRIAGGSSASGVGGSVTIQTTPNTAGNLANRQVVDLNGNFTFTQGIQTTGSPTFALWTGAAHTTLTASVEATDVLFDLSRTVEFSTGALTTQRAFVIENPTYAFVAASTITTAATFAILGAPVAGTNATITNALSFWVQAGVSRMDGGILGTRVVSAQTGATVTVTAADSGKVFTNEGTSADVQFNLPAAAAGLTYTFIQQDSVDLVKIQTTGDDTIRDGSVVTAAPGYIKSTARGDTVTLVAINATEWLVTYGTGNWTFDA